VPSAAHALFLAAMRERRQIVCRYQGHRREICPILLGRTGLEEKALVFQFGGSTSAGPVSPPGAWKCFRLAEVRDIALRDGPWHDGARHSASQSCMKMVEYDVNPDSPYAPAFRL
jgi:hypothetical protein